VNINDWDFHWQGFYFYKNLIKIPAGSRIVGKGVYDNTSNNPHNPFRPAQPVSVGEATTDEMFLISYMSLPYQAGDEGYDLESMMSLPVSSETHGILRANAEVAVFPNPSEGTFTIAGWNTDGDEKTKITVTDILGKTVYSAEAKPKESFIIVNLGGRPEGVYFIRLQDGRREALQKVVVRN
jgi:hypothetical protein